MVQTRSSRGHPRQGLREGALLHWLLVLPQVGQVHAIQHLRCLEVAEVYVDVAAILSLKGIEVVEGEVGWGLDMADLGLVPIQGHQVNDGACLWLPVKHHIGG